MARTYHTCDKSRAPLSEKPGRDRGLHRTSPGRIGGKTWSRLASETLVQTYDKAQLVADNSSLSGAFTHFRRKGLSIFPWVAYVSLHVSHEQQAHGTSRQQGIVTHL